MIRRQGVVWNINGMHLSSVRSVDLRPLLDNFIEFDSSFKFGSMMILASDVSSLDISFLVYNVEDYSKGSY